ncbi:MAG: histidine kinase [Steroidobacteraceae bacterium]
MRNQTLLTSHADWLDKAPFAYSLSTPTAQLEFANATLCGWLGYSRRELLGKRRSQLIDAGSLPALDAAVASLDSAPNGMSSFEADIVCKDGVRLPVDLHLRRLDPALTAGWPRFETIAFDRRAVRRAARRARNTEREELAFRLHDTIAQDLCGLHLEIAAMSHSFAGQPAMHERLAALEEIAVRSIASVHELMGELRSPEVLRTGLLDLIRRNLPEYPLSGAVQVDLQHNLSSDITTPAANALGLSCAEAIRNAVRHSVCNRIIVRIVQRRERLMILVGDDGLGIASTAVDGDIGLGLRSMRVRLARVGGRVRIWSRPGQGSIVALSAQWSTPPAKSDK